MDSLVPSAPETIEDLAELLHWLGDIVPSRVRYRPFPGTATEADVLASLEAPRKRLCELIDGVLVEKPAGFMESVLAGAFVAALRNFVRPRDLGIVAGADGCVRLWAGRVRIPDVAFVSWDRLPGRRVPREPLPSLVPDLAVEVLSPSNTGREMTLKRRDYFTAGVSLVWEVDPAARTVSVHTDMNGPHLLTATDTLDGGDVLPGFHLALAEFFAELDEHR